MNSIWFFLVLVVVTSINGQNMDLDKYEIYIGDTLISRIDFIKNGESITQNRLHKMQFKAITDGAKDAYNLDGTLYSKGKIENQKQYGFWEYWHSNGTKAREGEFINGTPHGIHKYWYENGNLRGIGNWKLGTYDGIWEMYSEDGKEKVVKTYKDGKLVED